MAVNPNKPSEFGGKAGLVQPAPHEPTASEKLMLMKTTGQDPDTIVDQEAKPDGHSFRGE